ncbi:response regulator transcription factor [Streptomyces huiliensis]|uniref:response regulator transcription factor n=1 Tax=Streptomyces huiliensis TaxID=2876027 RepID=UPI001CBFCFD9|nr:response regulator transcription factor [Streptomyces huiliensis]MBZ4318017.1 response regulator transcription factor [Streptomyces huiliensis]
MAPPVPSAGPGSHGSPGSPAVLVVDDDPEVRAAVVDGLAIEGYDVRSAADGLAALSAVAAAPPAAIVLDLAMPVLDGLAVCRRLRELGDRTPILVLTARDAVSDRVAGLDAGADDYLVKPFALDELLARLRALLRRAAPGPAGGADGRESAGRLGYADLTVDPATRTGDRGGEPLEFTRTEFTLLELFLRNPGQVLPRDTIQQHVWGADFGPESNSLSVYIGYLRRKLEAHGAPRLLHTVHGVGYRLADR